MLTQQWVEERYARAVVVVVPTRSVDESCNKNGMDLVHLLRPFCAVTDGPLVGRLGEGGERPMEIHNFGVRLQSIRCVAPVSTDRRDAYLTNLVQAFAVMDHAHGEQLDRLIHNELIDHVGGGLRPRPCRLSSTAALAQLMKRGSPPWHSQFSQDLHNLTRCSHSDTLDYPVGSILAVSTADVRGGGLEGVRRAFYQLGNAELSRLREQFPAVEQDLHSFHLLVHDAANPQSPPLEEVQQLLLHAQQVYGLSGCAVICINSIATPALGTTRDPTPWIVASPASRDVVATTQASSSSSATAAANGPTSPAVEVGESLSGLGYHSVRSFFDGRQVTGCHLSDEDTRGLREVMSFYLSQAIFKHMEVKLRLLNSFVQERRTTTFGKITAWFKGKDEPKPQMEVVMPSMPTAQPRYKASSLEMQMRRCGDLSLAMHDYNSAVSYYKMLLDELLSTLPQRSFNRDLIGACQEGIAVAQYLMGKQVLPSTTPWITGSTRSTGRMGSQVCRLEYALHDFLASGSTDFALRVVLLMFEWCRGSRGGAKPAVEVLQYALRLGLAARRPLISGVLHDMIASVYILVNPPIPARDVGMEALSLPEGEAYPVRVYLRQYAHLMVLAGSHYRQGGQNELALRCYLHVMEILRPMARQHSWMPLVEHVGLTVAHLHSAIGQEEKGLAVVCALMAHGSPIYSTPGEKCVVALQRLMAHQAKVMQQLNFSIYTQHPIPCIDRHTFQVYANYYGSDDDTEAPYSVMGVEAVELEWRMVEELLRDHYVASTPIDPSHGRAYRFPRFHGNSRKRAASLFPPSSSSSTCASIQSPDSSPHRRTHSSNPSHSMDSHHAAPPAAAAAGRLFHIHLGEPLLMSFVVRNPLGTTITLEDCCLLYQPTDGDAMLRSASMKAVVLQPLETKRVMIALNVRHVKTYVVVGLSWRLCGHDGYYYFATKESRPGAPESVFEYAMAHTSQQVEAPENVWVVVSPPMARIEAEMDPPLPATMYDGEYLHTQLRITNRSSKCAAHHVILQRSPHNAHLVWLEDFTMEQNLQSEASLLVAECLQPSASITLSITIRAQHNRGDAAIDCGNHHFFLLGYLPTTISSPTDDASTSAAGSTTSKVVAAPTVRLHRLLRRIRVRPLMAIYSTVLPPANASMAIAAAITAKNISNPRHGLSMLHICRIKTFHAPSWSVSKAFAGTIVSDDGRECYVHQGSSLTIPLLIQRQVRNTNTSDDDDDDSLVSSTCLSMEEACSTSPHTAEVVANVGDGDDAQHRQRHHFFCRLSYRGAGSVGERSQSKLILYVDGGGKHRATTEEEREREAREAEARQHGAPLVQYTPLVMVATWAVVEKDEERGSEFVHSGQTFHYIDPMAFLAPPPTSASQGSISSVEPATLTPSQLQHQQLLCAAMVRGVSSPYASRGALVYQVAVAPAVATSEVLPVAAVVPLTIRCLSLAPAPLMVRVAAKAPADIQDVDPRLPLVFVGKTAHHFLLLPSDEHEVRLTAHIMAPGVVDCNHLHVSVVPLRFTPHVCVKSGLSKRDFVLLLCNNNNNNNTSARLEEDSDAALAAVATPAGMLPGAVMVVGDGVPALTYAHFDHLPHATAAAAAFKEKNDVYREDWMRFAAQLRKYEEGIAQRGQGTHNQRYVYRPTVKCLSNSAEDDEQVEEAEEKVGFALGISARLAWLNATNAGGDARQTNAGPSVPLLPLISRSPRPSLVASQTSTLNTATTQLQVVHESAAETVMHVEASVPLFASPIKPRATHTPRPGGQSCAAPSSSLRIDLPATPAAASGVEGAGMHAQGDAGDADDVCGVGEEDFSAGSPLHYPSVQSNHSRSFDFPAGAEEVSITTSTEHSVASPPMASPPRQPPTEEGESELVDAGTTLDASPTSPEATTPPPHAHFHDPSELASSSMLDP